MALPLATGVYYALAEKQDRRKMRLVAGSVVRFVRWGGDRKASLALFPGEGGSMETPGLPP